MKKPLRFTILALLPLACGGPDQAAPPPQTALPPPQQQQAVPPPTAFNHPGFVYYNGAPPPAHPTPMVRMPAAMNRVDPVNLLHLQQAAAQPRRCNVPQEVAPGVFVHVDCYPYRRVPIAVKHATPAKLAMMQRGHTRWNAALPLIRPPTAAGGVRGAAPVGATAPGGGAIRASDPTQPMPDTVDHRLSGTEGPIKDQGDVGDCTAFALSAVMDNSFRRGNQNITSSPEHLWAHYGIPTMEDAAQANLNKPITTFDAWPYSGKEACELTRDPTDDCGQAYSVLPNTSSRDASIQQHYAAAEASGGHKVIAFEELEVSPPNIDEIVTTLASGADIWGAFNIDSSVWVNRKMQNFVIPDWSQPDGGHAIAISGYRNTPQGKQFLIHNSWGATWGDAGYAWVSQAMLSKWLHLAYKIRTDIDPGTAPVVPPTPNMPNPPAPPPAPQKPKTDEDCPGDQVMDSVTGMCAGICPDQSRPANGQCPNGPAPPPAPGQLALPGWPGGFPAIPGFPGWPPAPAQPAPPPQPGQAQPAPPPQPQPQQQPGAWTIPSAWGAPWPVPSGLPQFFPPPTQQTPPK